MWSPLIRKNTSASTSSATIKFTTFIIIIFTVWFILIFILLGEFVFLHFPDEMFPFRVETFYTTGHHIHIKDSNIFSLMLLLLLCRLLP